MTTREINFIDLLIESVEENIDEIRRELDEAGIDYRGSEQKVMEMIKRQRAEIKKEKGRKLRAKVIELSNKLKSKENESFTKANLGFAFRNLEGISEKDTEEIREDQELLEEIKKNKE